MSGHGPGDARKGQGTGDGRRKRPSRGRRFPSGRNSRRRGNVRKRGTGPRHDGRDQTVCPPRKRWASLITIFKDAQLHGQLAAAGAQQHIAALGQSARIHHDGAAHPVHGARFVDMPAQADIGLGFFKEFADDVNAKIEERISGRNREFAKKMIVLGKLSNEEIAAATDLSLEDVVVLRSQLEA